MKKQKIIMGCVALLALSGCNAKDTVYTHTDTAMGTIINQTIYGKEDVTKDVLSVITDLEEDMLSWRVENSEISQINASAGLEDGVVLSASMQEYLTTILDVAEKSEGNFDPTIGKITRLWNIDEQNTVIPKQSEIDKLLPDVGYQKLTLSSGRLYLPENSSLDFGAVGKGIACDSIYELLADSENVSGGVVSVGGSIVTYGEKPDHSNWNVAITHPREESSYLGSVSVPGGTFLSTSGDYERYVEVDGVRYHHIMNPHTGYPANSGLCSVTIVSDNGLLSDALSTACFVLGAEDGMTLAKQYDVEALFVTTEQEIIMTDGMEKIFTPVSGSSTQ